MYEHPSSLLQLAHDDAQVMVELGEWLTIPLIEKRVGILLSRLDPFMFDSERRQWRDKFINAYYEQRPGH